VSELLDMENLALYIEHKNVYRYSQGEITDEL
jgi:hypothetical protein